MRLRLRRPRPLLSRLVRLASLAPHRIRRGALVMLGRWPDDRPPAPGPRRDPATHALAFGPLDIALGLPDATAARAVDRLFPAAVRPLVGADRLAEVAVVATTADPPLIEVRVDGVSQSQGPPWRLGSNLMPLLTRRLLAAEADVVHVHAAAAVIDGGAVIVPGPSRTGKSVLGVHLARDGALLTDEVLAIDAEAGLVRAARRPVCIKASGLDLVAPMVQPGWETDAEQTVAWFPVEALGLAHATSAPPALVVEAVRGAGSTTVEPLEPTEVLELLISNVFELPGDGDAAFAALVWLAGRTRGARIRYHHPDAVPSVARAVLAAGPVEAVVVDVRTAAEGTPAAAPGVRTAILGDKALLYDERTRRIARLDAEGTEAWRRACTSPDAPLPPDLAEPLRHLGFIEEGAA